MSEEPKGRARGGHARAEKLSKQERVEIAKRAAKARWDDSLPQATHEGAFNIGANAMSCAVLPGAKRIVTQAAFMRAIGRARSPKAGTGITTSVDQLPFFLQAETLKPFLSEELIESTKPVSYRGVTGRVPGVRLRLWSLPRRFLYDLPCKLIRVAWSLRLACSGRHSPLSHDRVAVLPLATVRSF